MTRVWQQWNQSTANKLDGNEGGAKPKHKPNKGSKKKRFYQPETGTSQEEPHYSCGAKPSHPRSECTVKKAICYKCSKEGHYSSVADPRARMLKSMRYKNSQQQQHSTSTAFQKSTQQSISMLMSTPSRLQLSGVWTTQNLSHKLDHYGWTKNLYNKSTT